MQQIVELGAWRDYARDVRRAKKSIGLVLTMGALHEGHAELFRRARAENDVVIATIFVNARQFNNVDDLARYPRPLAADITLAEACGVDALVTPTAEAMWPESTATTVHVARLGDEFEGTGRPGHFDGVTSVVAKLFIINGACRAYFGEKDFQQLAIVRAMVRDLALEVEVVGCAIARDDDGLALSSRNVQLTPEGRVTALGLSRAIFAAGAEARTASQQRLLMVAMLEEAGVHVEYADVVDPATLTSSRDDESGPRRALVAGVVEGIRLIDNGPVQIVGGEHAARN
jgi:pantoate--beta-alanine ligase